VRLAIVLVLLMPSLAGADRGGWRFVEEQLKDVRPGDVVVTDVDYSVVDPRPRTQGAVRAFGMGRWALRLMGWDGTETAARLGHGRATQRRFQGFWNDFFWSPDHLELDRALATAEVLARAKAAGAEILYLTGRNDELNLKTQERLAALGFPDAHNVRTKREGEDTILFKEGWLRRLQAEGKRVLFYMSESPDEIEAARRANVPVLFVRGIPRYSAEARFKTPTPEIRGVRRISRLRWPPRAASGGSGRDSALGRSRSPSWRAGSSGGRGRAPRSDRARVVGH